MKNYFTSELLVRLEDYQNNNNQTPTRILINLLLGSLLTDLLSRGGQIRTDDLGASGARRYRARWTGRG